MQTLNSSAFTCRAHCALCEQNEMHFVRLSLVFCLCFSPKSCVHVFANLLSAVFRPSLLTSNRPCRHRRIKKSLVFFQDFSINEEIVFQICISCSFVCLHCFPFVVPSALTEGVCDVCCLCKSRFCFHSTNAAPENFSQKKENDV